jgi:hypothetical protein
METFSIVFTKKEIFALSEALSQKNGIKRRHKFGVVGLSKRIYEESKKFISTEEYEAFRSEWK